MPPPIEEEEEIVCCSCTCVLDLSRANALADLRTRIRTRRPLPNIRPVMRLFSKMQTL